MEPDYNPSRKTLIKNKWVAAAASIWIQCTAGSLYTFSIYSQALKSTQNYDQSTLTTISWFKDVGLLSGLLYSATAARCRPWLVLLAGSLQCFAGYFMMWLAVTAAIPRPQPAVMCLYMLVAAHAMTFFNTANVVTGVHNFPSYSGTIVGIMKGFLESLEQVKKMNQALECLLVFCSCFGCLSCNCDNHPEHSQINSIYTCLDIFSTFHVAVVPIVIAIRAQRYKSYRMVKSLLEHNQMSVDKDPIDDDGTDTTGDQDEYHELPNGAYQVRESNNNNMLHLREDVNLIGAMRTISFWLLFFTTACSMGSGLALVNNISQIGESLTTTSIGYAMIAFGFPGALYAGSVLVGVCYGSQWSLMPTIASELFGKEHLGTIFNTITSAGPIGSYVLSIWVVGFLYDKEVAGDGNICIGIQCFRFSFLIMAAVALSGSLVALVLFFWTRKFYRHVVLRRLYHSLRESKRIDYDD
ncbi:hypothetical protein SASPL_149485 [Salvia splendens]|uniref:Nodulin-like domain-containing protein n=1 Tax=Salvia splendens TaxID=180675 RepID=A0A8X8Z5A1_SALSN|nr:hypothetical protein SASPL_149485 [Salvia splendens]